MPYPNEHACRIRPPGDFQKDSFRRMKVGKLGLIIGRLHGKTTTTTQSFRYPKGDWTAERARAHCRKKGGRFEAAQKGKSPTIEDVTPEELKELSDEELQGLHDKCHKAYRALFSQRDLEGKDDHGRGTEKENRQRSSPDSAMDDADGGGS